jgi:hypothetical protein
MDSLPETSQGDIKQGLWFVFPLEGTTVRAWGGIAGLERVYVDSSVVSEKRSVGRSSIHTFAIGENTYQVAFRTLSYLRAHIECTLIANGKPLNTRMVRYVGGGTNVKRMPLSVLAAFAAAFVVGFMKWPLWMLVPAIVVIIVIQSKTRSKGSYVFAE